MPDITAIQAYIRDLQKGSAEKGFPRFVLICSEKKLVKEIGANRNKLEHSGAFSKTRSANRNKLEGKRGNRNKSG